ncbi:hypothetical protein ACH4ND_21455 [Streptomyces sp. NPDC017179]|uniref:hypothetical protein n=1 Tax=Streptomyces sp. NPDC017179 TaxID=3364979 RepID=UPI0037B47972
MRRWIAVCVAVLGVVSTGACTATHTGSKAAPQKPRPSAAARACTNGKYQWFNVERPFRLTALTAPEELGKGGGKFKNTLQRVWTPVTSVSAKGPTVPSREVLLSLAVWIGEAENTDEAADLSFTEVGRKAAELNEDMGSIEGAGRFVNYAKAHAVEADFRYTCPGTMPATTGHAKGWTGEGEGTLECGTRIEGVGRADQTVAREAARLSCGPDSVAAQA